MLKKDENFIIPLIVFTFIIFTLLIASSFSLYKIYSNKNYNSNDEIVEMDVYPETIYEEQEYLPENYNGFTIRGSEEGLKKLKKIIDNLNIKRSNYPDLKNIYYSDEYYCNGWYDNYDEEIWIFSCNETITVRDYEIIGEEIETFILAHELGHYVYERTHEWEENWADDYAHILSSLGEEIRHGKIYEQEMSLIELEVNKLR